MSKYIKVDDLFKWGKYSLNDAVKYGNKDADQQHFSYGTLMMYEIADEINDAPGFDTEISVDRLRELVEADRDGRLVALPCKVGDVVYAIVNCDNIAKYCDDDYFDGTGAIQCPYENDCPFENCDDDNRAVIETTIRAYYLDEDGSALLLDNVLDNTEMACGKTVFLTREEAEAALAEMEELEK